MREVLHVVYLVFSEGHAATSGADLQRVDLCEEAIRLARLLVEQVPTDGEVHGLLALLLLHISRRNTRTDAEGRLILLEDQDRRRWDRRAISQGMVRLSKAFTCGPPGAYTLQAAIAAEHAIAPTPEDTAWDRIVTLYDLLGRAAPSPVVALNRAVAVAMAHGPEAGLEALDPLVDDPMLQRSHLLPSARADLLRRLGRHPEAAEAYREALALVGTDPERVFLLGRLAEVGGTDHGEP